LPRLLTSLATPSQSENKEKKSSFGDQQAIAKQLADLLNFALTFDQSRMQRPGLSNDFSYYRRLLPKFNKHPKVKVRSDAAGGMALFTAEHIPMTKGLAKAAESAVAQNDNAALALGVMANSCLKMIKSKKFANEETNLFCARAMTGAIVVYDYVDPLSVFHKKCPIQLKDCIKTLKKEFPKEQALLNAIQYSTKNFSDASSSIQNLFD
jgi:hypothetical protein